MQPARQAVSLSNRSDGEGKRRESTTGSISSNHCRRTAARSEHCRGVQGRRLQSRLAGESVCECDEEPNSAHYLSPAPTIERTPLFFDPEPALPQLLCENESPERIRWSGVCFSHRVCLPLSEACATPTVRPRADRERNDLKDYEDFSREALDGFGVLDP